VSDVFGQKGYCHEHGKYKPCSKCQDVLIDIGIQIDKNRIRELEAMTTWQPIETMPEDKAVDVWVKSRDNQDYSRRACHVAIIAGIWYGEDMPVARYGEYASHWMPLPPPPEA